MIGLNMEIRIPWRVRTATYRIYQYYRCILSRLRKRKDNGLDISFFCDYHQVTGSTVAISCIANELATVHNVDAYIKPLSGYTRLLSLNVRQYLSSNSLSGEIVFVDIEQDNNIVEGLVIDNRQVILTCHAFPTLLHRVPQPKLSRNLELSTHIHFVSEHQRSEFIRTYPAINIGQKSFVIHNYTRSSSKQTTTNNIGIVGYANRKEKNVLKSIQLAQMSNAHLIQCWGSNQIAGLEDHKTFSKLKVNGWTDSIMEMHKSFDVLLSTSKSETFGLAVVEALSAGIPCVLSDIPVFRELYAECNGVVILSGDDEQDIYSINQLLDNAASLKEDIIEFWKKHFSNEVIKNAWLNKITELKTN